MSEASLQSLAAMLVGFCFAGLLSSLYAALRARPISFSLATSGVTGALSLPLLAFAGPAIIMRNTVRGRRYERRKVVYVAMATFIACWWSIAIGHLLLRLTHLLGA